MNIKNENILIIGAGNMGYAFISALIENKVSPKNIYIIEKKPSARLKKIQKLKKIKIFNTINKFEKNIKISITILTIKPNQLGDVFSDELNYKIKNSLIISIVAGKTHSTLKKLSKGNKNIARAMTNTPAAVGWGTSIIYFAKTTTNANKKRAMHLMNLIGQVEEVKSEKSIDTFTGLFGSGPAYLYLLIEIWSNYAKKNGFKYAEEMTVQTILGSILLLLHTKEKPESLRKRVTSKGGTTEAALKELNNNQKFQKLFEKAISKAIKKAITLSKN